MGSMVCIPHEGGQPAEPLAHACIARRWNPCCVSRKATLALAGLPCPDRDSAGAPAASSAVRQTLCPRRCWGSVAIHRVAADRRLIKTGRSSAYSARPVCADSATDPAPLGCSDHGQAQAREQWRPGMTPERLVEELDAAVKVPGLSNIWMPPIRNRIDMLATGIKSPVGVQGGRRRPHTTIDHTGDPDLRRRVAKTVPGVSSAWPNAAHRRALHRRRRRSCGGCALRPSNGRRRVGRGRDGDRRRQRRRGGRGPRALPHQCALSARDPRFTRNCARCPSDGEGRAAAAGDVAQVRVADGPPMLAARTRPSGWLYVDVRGRDLRSVVHDMQAAVAAGWPLPPG